MQQTARSYQAVMKMPFGALGISLCEGRLSAIEYLDKDVSSYRQQATGLAPVVAAIERYLEDPQSGFDLELTLRGTRFQQRVWDALQQIPSGETCTYGELAARLGSGARAVGNACRANPCPLVVPCHRVVAVRGLGGFAGERSGHKLEIKRWLLRHEGSA